MRCWIHLGFLFKLRHFIAIISHQLFWLQNIRAVTQMFPIPIHRSCAVVNFERSYWSKEQFRWYCMVEISPWLKYGGVSVMEPPVYTNWLLKDHCVLQLCDMLIYWPVIESFTVTMIFWDSSDLVVSHIQSFSYTIYKNCYCMWMISPEIHCVVINKITIISLYFVKCMLYRNGLFQN